MNSRVALDWVVKLTVIAEKSVKEPQNVIIRNSGIPLVLQKWPKHPWNYLKYRNLFTRLKGLSWLKSKKWTDSVCHLSMSFYKMVVTANFGRESVEISFEIGASHLDKHSQVFSFCKFHCIQLHTSEQTSLQLISADFLWYLQKPAVHDVIVILLFTNVSSWC